MSSLGRESWQQGLWSLWLLCLLGSALGALLWLAVPDGTFRSAPAGVNLHLFQVQDPFWLGIACLAVLVLPLTIGRRQLEPPDLLARLTSLRRRPVAMITLATVLITGAGVDLVYHGYALSFDEFLTRFQAETFLGGHLLAPLKPEWAAMADALQPIFMRYDLQNGLWGPAYRPMAAAVIALFELVHLGKYANVILAAGCLPLLAALARRLWPAERGAPAFAVFLLATSPQFLITAMTPYAMTAHLFFSLLWLVCFLRGGVGGHMGAALTGFIAVGLHQVHIHPVFVLPFMLSLLTDRRWKLASAYALWYAAVLLFWIFWRDIATLAVAMDDGMRASEGNRFVGRIASLLQNHSRADLAYWLANVFRFFAWQNLILVPLLYVALRHWRQAPRPVRLLGWSIALSLLPYLLFMPSQGHGWGYRYLHPQLGSFALIAVYGWLKLKESLDEDALGRARRVLLALAALGVFVGLPLRAAQVERFVAPFAASSDYVAAREHDVVLVDGLDIWFGIDLVRNDPFLERNPKVLEVHLLSDGQLERLCRRHRVALVDFETVRRFGMTIMPRPPDERAVARRALGDRLRDHGCLPS